MKKILLSLCLFCILNLSYSQDLFHDLNVEIDVKQGSLSVIDVIEINGETSDLYFLLNSNLSVKCLNEDISLEKADIDAEYESLGVHKYKVLFGNTKNKKIIPLSYEGVIRDEIKTGAAEYARGFSETTGTISDEGVYLAGSSYWVPEFLQKGLLSFKLTVSIDSSWSVVSQGERTVNNMVRNKKFIVYESPDPMDEIYLIAAEWTEYQLMSGDILVQAFLRKPDPKLAYRYLGVTSKYIKLYEGLIGKYPYKKFALVENFWETGYGMPSFTLLGEKVIRFPWILFSSYPHEYLHNYWGNSVYVDYTGGNWCEGITAYMADHLLKEQKGQGAEYRRTTLQKYSDFVNSENDFPLKEFYSRNNSAEEAIGYGKSLMLNEMLRYDLGDEIFLKAYSKFYIDNKFKKASWDDIRKSFEEISGKDLKPFFDQWLNKKGAPELQISNIDVSKKDNRYELSFNLSQVQDEDNFSIHVPVAIYLAGSDEVNQTSVLLKERSHKVTLEFDAEPLRIEVDPQYNMFRRLDKKEVPSSLSQVMGAKSGVIILPAKSQLYDEYLSLAKVWQQMQQAQQKSLEIISDREIRTLPSDKAVWVVGFENKFFEQAEVLGTYCNSLDDSDQKLFTELAKSGSLVYSISNPENEDHSIGFLGTNVSDALKGLTRKLPHYGKYSYLGFEGDEPKNTLKGVFPIVSSPLKVILSEKAVTAKLTPREALIGQSK